MKKPEGPQMAVISFSGPDKVRENILGQDGPGEQLFWPLWPPMRLGANEGQPCHGE